MPVGDGTLAGVGMLAGAGTPDGDLAMAGTAEMPTGPDTTTVIGPEQTMAGTDAIAYILVPVADTDAPDPTITILVD